MKIEFRTFEIKDMAEIIKAFDDIAKSNLDNFVYGSIIIEGDKYTIPFRTFDISPIYNMVTLLTIRLRFYTIKYNFSKIVEDGIEKYEGEIIFYRW